ncbi:NfeD family protein [Kingella sp. (in: b-proteobacteria)]|uniref:NfeD family protein n=1 Tax=Kingella sp. (in: b-proteobacteria) TaxID=2020713 RepID=UPI0026DA8435|nr:NfeD family protein [Kingella sp. (in: b-proteobacteria)]MDO4657474.1 NfeD family protein [Kingella sp. (in: b-proteobacteria)]
MALWTYWLIAAVAVFMLELFSGTVYLLVLSAALAGAWLTAWLFNASAVASMLVAAFLSAVGTLYVYRLRGKSPKNKALQQHNDLDIGSVVQIEQPLSGGAWRVFYRGTTWEARAARPHAHFQMGDNARICGKDGITLLIEPLA